MGRGLFVCESFETADRWRANLGPWGSKFRMTILNVAIWRIEFNQSGVWITTLFLFSPFQQSNPAFAQQWMDGWINE